MEKGTQTFIENLKKNTGKSLEEWVAIAQKENFAKHGEIMKFLKEKHGFTHGFANLVALSAKGTHSASVENKEDLVAAQYNGKAHFKPLYDHLVSLISTFGNDVEIAPKQANVSIRRKKQFALLTPATRDRFEIGINLKGQEPEGKLEGLKPGGMCSHRINVASIDNIDEEVTGWLKKAYDHAG